jgi:hypothetical protein
MCPVLILAFSKWTCDIFIVFHYNIDEGIVISE